MERSILAYQFDKKIVSYKFSFNYLFLGGEENSVPCDTVVTGIFDKCLKNFIKHNFKITDLIIRKNCIINIKPKVTYN
jgi:hypothetical protein